MLGIVLDADAHADRVMALEIELAQIDRGDAHAIDIGAIGCDAPVLVICCPRMRRGVAPFALLRNTRKTEPDPRPPEPCSCPARRRGIGPGSMSFHPAGIPHGPHPGAYEGSIGVKATTELAVMLDCYEPLQPTAQAVAIEDPHYHDSFRG